MVVGDESEEYKKQLKQKMNKKIESIKQDNERHIESAWRNFLEAEYFEI